MPTASHCLECNAPLSPADTGGFCPKCLLKLGLASQLATGTLPATAQGLRPDGVIEEPFDFGGYRILRLLGKGGMGAVYEAEQAETGRRVALKVLGQSLDTPEMRQRFLREGQLAASVRHGNVVTVLGAGEVESVPVIAMELLHAGTLKDGVSRGGPLPPQEAVDVALQIIAGLDAARAAGVLHRDVKPANCFRNPDGTVKVGDFGLSISTLVKAEHSLTQSGTVLGTPSFAAPEQLRGEEVDSRADIYAVGATLYFLLTGAPPFEEESLVALIAKVLEKPPVDVAQRRPGIPAGLRNVVMRCLEKQRDRRFPDYTALRAALAPYSSAAPTPGTLGLRFAAGLVDLIGTLAPAMVGTAIFNDPLETHWIGDRAPVSVLLYLLSLVWIIGWYALPEGLWGRSLGKFLCGLRVVRTNGQPIGLGAAVGRSCIFSLNALLGPVCAALFYSPERYRAAVQQGEWLNSEWLWLLLFVPLFVTMRRRNGYAAMHDLLSGSRVVEEHAATHALARAEPFLPDGATTSADRVGPYVLLERNGPLAEAFDPVLRRRVWILFRDEGAPAIAERRREIVRPSRLRWLQGSRGPGENWDAFDRPHGLPLLARRGAEEPWQTARVWLADLADELHASLAQGTLPGALSLAHVWVTDAGHAVILDFPFPAATEAPARPVTNAGQMQDFLSEAVDAVVSPIMPLHARDLLAACRERRLEATALVAGNLRAIAERRATVEPRRRALSAVLGFNLFVTFFALVGAAISHPRGEFDRWWAQTHPQLASPRVALEVACDALEDHGEEPRALIQHLASQYGAALVGDEFWHQPAVKGLESMGLISRPVEYFLVSASNGRQPPANAEHLPKLLARQAIYRSGWLWAPVLAMHATTLACVLGVLFALLFRTSPMLRMFGYAVARSNGAPAERWRVALRALIASIPAIATSLWILTLERWFWRPEEGFWFLGLGVVVTIWCIWLAGFLSGRGPGERVTGTWIVPR